MSFIRCNPSLARRALLHPTPTFAIRAFTKPSTITLNAEDEQKHRASYEKHRVEVDPKLAGIDETMTFEHPKVSFAPPTMGSGMLIKHVEMERC